MAEEQRQRDHKNVPGPFFVEDTLCICCGAPESEAPDLMAHDENKEVRYHCYFRKQPTTPDELERAIRAVEVSCCGAVQYDGDDPEVLRRLAETEERQRRLWARNITFGLE